ncbi:hypothetical protein JCM21900_002549, partial [Sporobolomyces salmonicolor]
MSKLDTFLVDLGAPALSTHLAIPPSGAPLKGPAAGVFDRLQNEIDSVNDETLHLLKDRWDDFQGQLRQGGELLQKLGAEEDELRALEREMDGPEAFLPPLIAQLESHQSLSTAHAHASHSVTLLSSLLSFHQTISALSSSITAGHLFPAALDAVKSVTSAIEEGAEEWVEETEVWKAIVQWAGEEESRLESALQGAVEGCFDFSTDKAAATSTLTLRTHITAAPSGPQLSLLDLLKGLEDLVSLTGRPERVTALLAGVVKQLLRRFVAPYLEANGAPAKEVDAENEAKRRMEFDYPASNEEGAHAVILRPASDSTSLPDPIAALETFLTFFTSHSSLFPSPPSRHTSIVTAHLTPPLQSYLISAHLTPSLPPSTSSLTPYLALLTRATTLEATFLPSLHLFAFLPSSSQHDGHEPDEQRILRSWSASVPSHWARSVSDRALARVRGAVKSWDWGSEGGEEVEVEVREEEEMEGLLRGLELGLEELDEDGKRRERGEQEKERRMELETVPKGAKREMTLEEATAPRPPRRPRTPSPPPPAPSHLAQRPATPPTPTAPQGSVAKKTRKLKLGAAKIVGDVFLPPRSPSPPLLFQGGDAAPPPSSPSPAPTSIVHPDPKPIFDGIFEPLEAPSHSPPQQVPAPSISPERDEEEAKEDEGFAVKVEEKHQELPREEGVRVLHREIEPEQVEQVLEDVKPLLFVKEESVEFELPTTKEPAAEEKIEWEVKPEPVEEALEDTVGHPEEEDLQHFVPPLPPLTQQTIISTLLPLSESIVSPPIQPEPLLPPPRATPPVVVEPEPVLPPPQSLPSLQPSTAPPSHGAAVPAPPRTDVPPPPRMAVPPPPRARSGTGPSVPPPPPRTNAVPPPPPRAGAGFPPPPPRGVLSSPQVPQRPMVSPPPRDLMSPPLPHGPQQRVVSPSGPPPRHIISPPPVSRLPAPLKQPFPAPSVSPKPPQPPAFALPPGTFFSPSPQSHLTPTLPSSQPFAAPAQPQPQRSGPILNHIQQRFVSPPPSKMNPYSPFPIPAAPPPQQSSVSGTYIPANDPLLADLFSSSASASAPSAGGQTTRNYFAPDPPGRLQRSNSTSSQTSSIEGAGGYRPSSRGSNPGYAPSPQRAYSPMQQYGGYPSDQQLHQQPQQGSYGGQGPWGLQDDLEELEERFAAGGGGDGRGYGQHFGGEQPAMRLRGGLLLSDSDDDSDEEEEHEEEEHDVLRLRGGASLDLGEMNDDDGNRSGDDWGFGDGDEAGEGEEDAWGFGDGDLEEGTPSPPSEPSPPRSAPTLPSHRSLPSVSHAPSASISPTTSFASPSRPRQPSYAFSPSIPSPSLSSLGAAIGVEMAEAGEGEDDAWGFDEELEDEAEPVAAPAEPSPAPPEPTLPAATNGEAGAEVDEWRLGGVSVEPPSSVAAPLETSHAPSSPPVEHEIGDEDVDDWGLGAEEPTLPEDVQALVPTGLQEPAPPIAPPVEPAPASPIPPVQPEDFKALATDELAPEGIEFSMQRAKWPAEAAEPFATGEEETVLTAPAEQQPFPVEPAPESIEPAPKPIEPAPEPVEPATEFIEPIPESAAPTPRLLEPLPHHDVSELHPEDETTEARLEDFVARQLDDAALLNVEAGEVEDGWGLEADEDEVVESGLVAEEAFKADAKEAEDQEAELPVEEALFEPTPPHVDVAPAASAPPESLEPLAQGIFSREPIEPSEPSPTHSDTVLVDSTAAAMSSPEVIEKSDAWGANGDEAEVENGAEVLTGESLAPASSQEPVEDESIVEHQAERPVLHDESTVQHEAERPILDLPAATPHPTERTVTPPLEALPREKPITEDEGWDLDERRAEGAEALAAESLAPELPQAPVEDESVVAHEAGRPVSYDESTVQHEAERPILDLPAATPHPMERTATPPLEALPHEEAIAEEEGWDLDEPKAEGAEALAAESLAPELPQAPVEDESVVAHEAGRPVSYDESTVQHEAERPILDLPAATPHPMERTATPPLEALPHEEAIAEEEGWDLDEPKAEGAEALAAESLAPELPQAPVED